MNKKYFGEFAKYTSLNVLGMLGLSCYILADTFFIARGLGSNGLAALNLALPIYSFIHGIGLMLGMGGATEYSIVKIQSRHNESNRIFTSAVYMAVLFSLSAVFAGLFLSNDITQLMGADSRVEKMTNTYLKMILLFSPSFIMNNILICFVRNDGNPNLSMLAMLGGSFSNIILDYVFIFPLGMGIFGAVFATCLAPIISMCILAVHISSKRKGFHFIKTSPSISIFSRITASGIPSLITEFSSGIVMIVFNSVMLKLCKNTGVAAYGVIANISIVAVSVYTGIAQGIQPLLSKAHGSADLNGIHHTLKYALTSIAVISTVIYSLIFFNADTITQIFNSENSSVLQDIAVNGLKLYFIAIPFAGFNIIISVFFTSTAKPKPAQVISVLRGIVLIVPMAYIMSALFGIYGAWLSYPLTEAAVAVIAVISKKLSDSKQ